MPQATGTALVQQLQRAADAQHKVNLAARQAAQDVAAPTPPPTPPAERPPATKP